VVSAFFRGSVDWWQADCREKLLEGWKRMQVVEHGVSGGIGDFVAMLIATDLQVVERLLRVS